MTARNETCTPSDAIRIMWWFREGLISRRTALELIGFVKDIDEELRRIAEEGK